MNPEEQKVVQYLGEAYAEEDALTHVLQSQIVETSEGLLRTVLEAHLDQTRMHAARVGELLDSAGRSERSLAVAVWQEAMGLVLAIASAAPAPFRGTHTAQRELQIAKDAYAAEARQVVSYVALEQLARAAGDNVAAAVAASILVDERAMLASLTALIPTLSQAVLAHSNGAGPHYDLNGAAAARVIRDAGTATRNAALDATRAATRAAQQARRIPGVTGVEDQFRRAVALRHDANLAGYDDLTAKEIVGKLAEFSQNELAKIHAYEGRNAKRGVILDAVNRLLGSEPWAGYDELTAGEIRTQLLEARRNRAGWVSHYESAHKDRSSVLTAAAAASARRKT